MSDSLDDAMREIADSARKALESLTPLERRLWAFERAMRKEKIAFEFARFKRAAEQAWIDTKRHRVILRLVHSKPFKRREMRPNDFN